MARPSRLHLHKSGQWTATIDGQQHYFGRDERQAQAKFYRAMARALEVKPTDRPATINGAVAAFIALNDKRCWREWLARFIEYAGGKELDTIEPDLLTLYALHLRKATFTRGKSAAKRELSPKSIRHYVASARTVLLFAKSKRWIAEVPDLPKLAKPVRKARDVATARLREILAELPERSGRILRFIAATGCRPSEACKLEWEHVRPDLSVCVLPAHKTADATGKPRTIYLTPDAVEILRGIDRGCGPVFASRLGTPYTVAGLRSIIRKHGVTPYMLRHSFAQRATDAGISTADLARLMGHENESTTRFYREVRDGRAVEAASRLRLIPAAG